MDDRFDYKKGLEKKSKFLEETKEKYDKKGIEQDALKAKPIKVEGLLDDMNSFPGKVNISGPVGYTSVKKKDPENANKLHGADGKPMAGEKKEDD